MGTTKLRTLFQPATPGTIEWPTLLLLAITYAVWALATTWLAGLSTSLAVIITAIAIAQFSSLQHEAIHGHP
ncbi:MAG: fatty acid desaturase, partial [Boseongicola sp.]|nr:fatty acid desaturase [Boseongicola sp.]